MEDLEFEVFLRKYVRAVGIGDGGDRGGDKRDSDGLQGWNCPRRGAEGTKSPRENRRPAKEFFGVPEPGAWRCNSSGEVFLP